VSVPTLEATAVVALARRFDLPVRVVVDVPDAGDPVATGVAAVGEGVMVNSGDYDGMTKAEAIAAQMKATK